MKTLVSILIAALLVLSGTIWADEIIFRNGDRLRGKVIQLVEGKMTFQSDMAGQITIDMANVETFSTDTHQRIQIGGADIADAKIEASSDQAVRIRNETFPVSQVTAINPPLAVLEEPQWTGDITVDLAAQRGNTEQNSANVRMTAKKTTEKDEIQLQGQYRFNEQENTNSGQKETTQDNFRFGGKYKYFRDEKSYWYGNASYERDRVAKLDRRIIAGGGWGYRFIQSENFNWSGEVGLAAIHEQYADQGGSSDELSAQAGYEMDWTINEKMVFLHTLTYYPSFGDLADYFLTTGAELRLTLSEKWFTSLRVELDHDSSPAPGTKQTDERYVLGLGYKF